MLSTKRQYQVMKYVQNCSHPECKSGCVGHKCLGISDENALYTYKRASDLFKDWKREYHVVKCVLLLDGIPIEQWERQKGAFSEETLFYPQGITDVRTINDLCFQSSQGRTKNVYCSLDFSQKNYRVIRARSVVGRLQVCLVSGEWAMPLQIYQN